MNVSGTQTKNGVTANVYANNAPISHGMGFSMVKLTVSESETSVSSTNVGGVRVFRDAKKHCDFQHRRV